MKLSFQVADFDAPLDMILYLVSKHKLNIIEIDISSLLEQYMQMITTWQEQNLEVASEFLEMASRLVYIKTVSLLPQNKEESERLRQNLTGELMEYQLCKYAAGVLAAQNQYAHIYVRNPIVVELDNTYTLTHPPTILYQALLDAMGKYALPTTEPPTALHSLVVKPFVSVESRMGVILRLLKQNTAMSLKALFARNYTKSAMVATFLAVLELIKNGSVSLQGQELYSTKIEG